MLELFDASGDQAPEFNLGHHFSRNDGKQGFRFQHSFHDN